MDPSITHSITFEMSCLCIWYPQSKHQFDHAGFINQLEEKMNNINWSKEPTIYMITEYDRCAELWFGGNNLTIYNCYTFSTESKVDQMIPYINKAIHTVRSFEVTLFTSLQYQRRGIWLKLDLISQTNALLRILNTCGEQLFICKLAVCYNRVSWTLFIEFLCITILIRPNSTAIATADTRLV